MSELKLHGDEYGDEVWCNQCKRYVHINELKFIDGKHIHWHEECLIAHDIAE